MVQALGEEKDDTGAFFPTKLLEILVNFVQSRQGHIWTIFLPLSVTNYSIPTTMCRLHITVGFYPQLPWSEWLTEFTDLNPDPVVSQNNSSHHSGTHILSKYKPKQKLNYKHSIATFRSITGISIIPATKVQPKKKQIGKKTHLPYGKNKTESMHIFMTVFSKKIIKSNHLVIVLAL